MSWINYDTFLISVLVISGPITTLCTKMANKIAAEGSDGKNRFFVHPFLQAGAMFVSEILCLMIFKLTRWWNRKSDLVKGNRKFNPVIFFPAAILDVTGTSLMCIGLSLTNASSFQMIRLSVVMFQTIFVAVFFGLNIKKREVIAMLHMIQCITLICAMDYNIPSDDGISQNKVLLGDFLIIFAQIVAALQFVYEETYVKSLNIPPLQAVGWIGINNFIVLSVLLVLFNWIPAPPHFDLLNARGTVEDVIDGLVQIGNNYLLLLSMLGITVSLLLFNIAAINLSSMLSPLTITVIDATRILTVWMIALALLWEQYNFQYLFAFSVLMIGICTHNALTPSCQIKEKHRETKKGDRQLLVVSEGYWDQ